MARTARLVDKGAHVKRLDVSPVTSRNDIEKTDEGMVVFQMDGLGLDEIEQR